MLISPVVAVIITLWHQNRKEKRQQKLNTFFKLIAYQDHTPIHADFLAALNTLQILFHDCPKVIQVWKAYYQALRNQEYSENPAAKETLDHLKFDLLHEIADELGYNKIRDTDFAKFYLPSDYPEQFLLDKRVRIEFLAFLENTNRFYARSEQKNVGENQQ